MHKLKTLARVNPVSYSPYLVAFFVGVAIADTWGLWLLPAILSLISFIATGYALNWYADARSGVDAIARDKDTRLRENPFLTGKVTFTEYVLFVILFSFFGILLFFVAFILNKNLIFLYSFSIAIFLSVVCYNIFYWKSKPILDILCIPIGIGALLVLAGMQNLSFEPLIYGALTVPLYLESEIWDIEEDARCGLKTTAVVLGEKKARMCCYALYSAAVASSIFMFPQNPLFCVFIAVCAGLNLTPIEVMRRFKLTIVLIIVFLCLSPFF